MEPSSSPRPSEAYEQKSVLTLRADPLSARPSEIRQNIQKTLWVNQHTRALVFDESSLRYVASLTLDALRFHHLTQLMITVRGFSQDEKTALSKISQFKFPVLQMLRIDSVLLRGELDCALLYATIFDFVALHSTLLKYLTIRHSFRPFSPWQEPPKLTFPFSDEKLRDMIEDLGMLQLDELTIFLDDYEGQNKFNLGWQILKQQLALFRLEVQVGRGDSSGHYTVIAQAMENNSRTLRHLAVAKSPMNSNGKDLRPILINLANVSNLENLRLFSYTWDSLACPVLYSVRYLDITGALCPAVLEDIPIKFPRLEELQFSNLKSDFGVLQNEWEENLRILLRVSKTLRIVRWYCPHVSLEFMNSAETGVIKKTSPTNAFAAIILLVNNKNV